jgi:hypothetical protein
METDWIIDQSWSAGKSVINKSSNINCPFLVATLSRPVVLVENEKLTMPSTIRCLTFSEKEFKNKKENTVGAIENSDDDLVQLVDNLLCLNNFVNKHWKMGHFAFKPIPRNPDNKGP